MPEVNNEVIDDEVVDQDDSADDSTDDNEGDSPSKDSKRTGYKARALELEKELEATRKALAERNKENEKRRKQVKAWEEMGVEPTVVKEMLTAKEQAEEAKLEEKGEWEKIKQKMLEERDKALAEKDSQIADMQTSLENTLWTSSIRNELLANDGVPELLEDKVKGMTKLIHEDGVFDIAVLDDSGEIRYDKNGERLKLTDMMSELKEHPIYGRAFPAPSIGGVGTKPQGAGSSKTKADTSPKKPRSEMNPAEKKAYILEHGITKYNALPLK